MREQDNPQSFPALKDGVSLRSLMKIQLVSDTHGDFRYLKINPEVDLVIHAGDISNSIGTLYQDTKRFHSLCRDAGVDYLYVLGNHDYYTLSDISSEEAVDRVYDPERLLVKGKPVLYKGILFVGCTLWSGTKDWYVARCINDFNYIRRQGELISLSDMNEWFESDKEYLESFRGQENTFILTHFPPSEALCHERFKGDPLNSYFLNNLDLSGYGHWACGHTHHSMRTQVDGCNLYLNAYGYTSGDQRECPEFDTNFIIEV